jgi:dTDP-4-amino-4,6-dideoxygalactose transaminase
MTKILFNNISYSADLIKNITHLLNNYELFREKYFSTLCLAHLQKRFHESELLLTHSATGALEMIATLIEANEDDEIIMPSFTYVSSANAFVNRGAKPVFVDIDPHTLCINADLVESAITPKTKAIVAVHYGGHACNLDALKIICNKHKLFLIEDAAMSYGFDYNGRPVGSIGDFGVISFDITKHISAIQGGLLLINNDNYKKRAHQIYHIGTNRVEFMNGSFPYYEWVDYGSKYQMNEMNAVVLYDALMHENELMTNRINISRIYYEELHTLISKGIVRAVPTEWLSNNIHLFYVIIPSAQKRNQVIQQLHELGIEAVFHYQPLHSSPMGKRIVAYHPLPVTESVANSILRLPMHSKMDENDVRKITNTLTHLLSPSNAAI